MALRIAQLGVGGKKSNANAYEEARTFHHFPTFQSTEKRGDSDADQEVAMCMLREHTNPQKDSGITPVLTEYTLRWVAARLTVLWRSCSLDWLKTQPCSRSRLTCYHRKVVEVYLITAQTSHIAANKNDNLAVLNSLLFCVSG